MALEREQVQQTIIDRLFWHTAERDDAKVADHLFRDKAMDAVYTLDEATLFDLFFHFLREIGAFELIESLKPVEQKRQGLPFLQFVLVFLMKTIASIPKMDPVHDLLLTDELLMGVCGFNGYQVRNGSCERGVKLRKTPAPQIRGAICVDTLANQIVKISPRAMEAFFNACIRCLAGQGYFPKYIHCACDATDYETTAKYKGCGCVSRERKVFAKGRRKNGELKAVKVRIYGWKVWAIYEINTGIPLAIKIDTIEKPDNLHILAVLEQAKENVAASSTIRSLVIDRGFLDGKVLYAIDQQGIQFVIPLKSNMDATHDARALALDHDGSHQACRDVEVTHGQGKHAYIEKVRTELIGVPGLLTCDWFNPQGSEAYTAKKDYEPIPLNAVVVKTWDNKTPPIDKQVVMITNGNVSDPFIAFDRYDDRSLIENGLFRDTKQNWNLLDPPKKIKEGVFVQVYTVMAMKALTTAFLIWQKEQARLHEADKETSWNMYRRRLKSLNRNKLIVFFGLFFGIYYSHEVFMLAGVPVFDTEKESKITREEIYTKYTGQPPPDSS
jgi:Transposase DDE domain